MRSKSTIVGLIFLAGFALTAWVIDKALTSLFVELNVSNQAILGASFTLTTLIGVVLAAGLAGFAFSNRKSKSFVGESVDELSKVSWPEGSEVRVNTVVVIVFSIISATVLGVFDQVFAWLTSNNLFLY